MAQSLIKYAQTQGINEYLNKYYIKNTAGLGALATNEQEQILIGNIHLTQSHGIHAHGTQHNEDLDGYQIYITINTELVAKIVLAGAIDKIHFHY